MLDAMPLAITSPMLTESAIAAKNNAKTIAEDKNKKKVKIDYTTHFDWLRDEDIESPLFWQRQSKHDTRFWVMGAQLSGICYKNPDEQRHYTEQLRLKMRPFKRKNTQASVYYNDHARVVAYRGTELHELGDVRDDKDIDLVTLPDITGRVHQGFARYEDRVHAEIVEFLRRIDRNQYTAFVGHSLGAAAAIIGAARMLINIDVGAYGSPLPGNPAFARHYPQRVLRFSRYGDIVTRLPPPYVILWKFFSHVGACNLLDDRAQIYTEGGFIQWTKVTAMNLWESVGKMRLIRDFLTIDEHGIGDSYCRLLLTHHAEQVKLRKELAKQLPTTVPDALVWARENVPDGWTVSLDINKGVAIARHEDGRTVDDDALLVEDGLVNVVMAAKKSEEQHGKMPSGGVANHEHRGTG